MTFFLVAASIRALSQSVRRSGHDCIGADLFGDWDTAQVCNVTKIHNYQSIIYQMNRTDCRHLVIGGGLENHVNLLENVERNQIEIVGCGSEAIERVRNPFDLHETLMEHCLHALDVTNSTPGDAAAWIQKPFKSAGGNHVRYWPPHKVVTAPGTGYLQRFAEGVPQSASYISGPNGCTLFGVSKQIVRSSPKAVGPTTQPGKPAGRIRSALAARSNMRANRAEVERSECTFDFAYRGSVGPIVLEEQTINQLVELGTVVSRQYKMVGWFGIDFIINDQGLWPLEVNPRYTSSMEIFERHSKIRLFDWHLAACRGNGTSAFFCEPDSRQIGKCIVSNETPHPVHVETETFDWLVRDHCQALPRITDIPNAGSVIESGQPICTVWAEAPTITEVERLLERRSRAVLSKLG